MDIKEQQLRVRLTDMGHFAFADIKELTGKSVSEICREIMNAGLLHLMRCDAEHPLSHKLLRPRPIEEQLQLYADFLSAKYNVKDYGFRQIKEGGEIRYLITAPMATGSDYWKSVAETLAGMGIPKDKIPEGIELWKKKMQEDADKREQEKK